jgi:hypothetical protein
MDQKKQRRALRAQTADIQDRLNVHGPGRPGGPLGFALKRKGRPGGSAAIIRRLRRYHPELHQQVLAGEMTPHRAVIAGWRGKGSVITEPLPHLLPLLQAMELWLGPSHNGSAFNDDDERRRLWTEHRERLMRWFAHDGRRPQAWWKFEAPFKYPGFNQEKSALWAAGLLGAAEARALERDWREEFDRSLAFGFTFNDGPRGTLTGEAAHIAHIVHHDIPAALADQWRDCDDAFE